MEEIQTDQTTQINPLPSKDPKSESPKDDEFKTPENFSPIPSDLQHTTSEEISHLNMKPAPVARPPNKKSVLEVDLSTKNSRLLYRRPDNTITICKLGKCIRFKINKGFESIGAWLTLGSILCAATFFNYIGLCHSGVTNLNNYMLVVWSVLF